MEITGILLFAIVIEGTIAYLFGKSSDGVERPWIKYISFVLGIAVSIAYQINIPAMFGMVAVFPYVGYIISGVIIGRGSNYVNDIVGALKR